MTDVFIVAARRTAVAPRNGAFRKVEAAELAAPVIAALIESVRLEPRDIDHVILGNALYGGGNPARVAALAAGLPHSTAATTIDTQCCAGLDAIAFGAALIAGGKARVVVAGGVESYSRSPLRAQRPRGKDDAPQFYDRPPFTPWPDTDPEMIDAAAALASELGIARAGQQAYAIASHAKAIASRVTCGGEIVPIGGQTSDSFSRKLSEAICMRLPLVAGDGDTGLTAATIAVEADAAAGVLLVDESLVRDIEARAAPLRYIAGSARGGDPVRPGLAAIEPARLLLAGSGLAAGDIAAVEIMEAFAIQAMAFVDALGFPQAIVNRGGGALARGHPIGASGAILAVRLFTELQSEAPGAKGIAAIAAAGGLGSAALFERC